MLNGVGTQGLLICGFKEEGRVLGWQDCRSVVRGVEWVRSRDGDRLGADLHSRALNTEFFKSMDNGELVTFSLLLCHPFPPLHTIPIWFLLLVHAMKPLLQLLSGSQSSLSRKKKTCF